VNPSILSCFLARLPIALPISLVLNWVLSVVTGWPTNWPCFIVTNIGVTFLFAMHDAQKGGR
jgi:hypothetical protein